MQRDYGIRRSRTENNNIEGVLALLLEYVWIILCKVDNTIN